MKREKKIEVYRIAGLTVSSKKRRKQPILSFTMQELCDEFDIAFNRLCERKPIYKKFYCNFNFKSKNKK